MTLALAAITLVVSASPQEAAETALKGSLPAPAGIAPFTCNAARRPPADADISGDLYIDVSLDHRPPCVVELLDEFIPVHLRLALCRERMYGSVADYSMLENGPAKAPLTLGISLDFDDER